MAAVSSYKHSNQDNAVIRELLKNYADINYIEWNTGINAMMVGILTNDDVDALAIVKTLCEHRFYEGQDRIADVDQIDFEFNSALHHAAKVGHTLVCKYLLNVQQCNAAKRNADGKLAIDLA